MARPVKYTISQHMESYNKHFMHVPLIFLHVTTPEMQHHRDLLLTSLVLSSKTIHNTK